MPDPAGRLDDSRRVRFGRGACWLLANPRAGRGRAAGVGAAVARAVRGAGWDVTVQTDHPASRLPSTERPDAVIALGGDGTIRAAVAALLNRFGNDPPPVLPVPMGTANLLGQYLGLPRPVWHIAAEGSWQLAATLYAKMAKPTVDTRLPRRLRHTIRRAGYKLAPHAKVADRQVAARTLAALETGRATRLDVGAVNGEPFLLMAGIGFDAHVVSRLDRRRQRGGGAIGLASYAVPALDAVAGYGFPPLSVEVDGKPLWGPAPGIVMIANVPQYGTGFPIVPNATATDGVLDVVCLPVASKLALARLFALAATGKHLSLADGAASRGRSVTVSADADDVPVQVDGDPGGTLPITATVHPAAVPFVSLKTER